MPNKIKIQTIQQALDADTGFQRRELADVWADLLRAAETDPEARRFVDSFGAEAARMFAGPADTAD